VIGTDTAAAAVAAAMRSARERGLSHVSFREGDPAEMQFDRAFDAVIGRYVLLFQADPVAMVRKLAGHVRTGGWLYFMSPIGSPRARFHPRRPTTAAAGG
jgi:2-polyprenyl-3-methyl-5-hydroxy-6-metoxy-1,4-benzoquinol methylase